MRTFYGLGTTSVLYSLVKLGRTGLKIGFGGWRGVLNVEEITLKKLNKQSCIAKLS